MADGWVEYVFVSGDSCETFCSACGQLRLWAKPEKPKVCGCCGSTRIVIGPLLGEQLPKLREEWIARRMKAYSCVKPLDRESEFEQVLRCGEAERYRARSNEPRHAHLCADHWAELSEEERAQYSEVDARVAASIYMDSDGVVVVGEQSAYTDEEAS